MKVRAFRGATQLSSDTEAEMESAVCELLLEIFKSNSIDRADLISILFTATPDLICEFPAKSARALDLGTVPLMCAVEVDVKGALSRVIRVMVHAHSELSLEAASHIYLRGAQSLRRDLAQ